MANISATSIGKAVARSGLLPRTAAHFLAYLNSKRDEFIELLTPRSGPEGADVDDEQRLDHLNAELGFIMFHWCYSSPEFGDDEVEARRFLPYPLGDRRESSRAARLERYLEAHPWDSNVYAVNAADISTDWILGESLAILEDRFESLRGGMIWDMHRTAASHLSGLADILTASLSSKSAGSSPDTFFEASGDLKQILYRLNRRIRQYSLQVSSGLPEDILWMAGVLGPDRRPLLPRRLAMALRKEGMNRLEDLLDRGRTDVLMRALNEVGHSRDQVAEIRAAAEHGRRDRTNRYRERVEKRLPNCGNVAANFFESQGLEFEDVLEQCLECLGVEIVERDGSKQHKPRFPDFVVRLWSGDKVVIECKSAHDDKDIKLSDATEVAGKAAPHGLAKQHLITVCQKYVSTDVPRQIEAGSNLSVINAEDMALAMAYTKSGTISAQRFESWLTTPGQPRIEELFLG